MAFFAHPGVLEVDELTIELCFRLYLCPTLSTLGQISGRTPADVAVLDAFCERIADRRPDIVKSLGGSCEKWSAELRGHLSEGDGPRGSPGSAVIPIQLWEFGKQTLEGVEHSITSPLMPVRIDGGEPVEAVVDTGSSEFSLAKGVPLPEHLASREGFLTNTSESWVSVPGLRLVRKKVYRLNGVGVGPLEYRNVAALYSQPTATQIPGEPQVGMSMLLRHEAVCFDWVGNMLHLGSLGPCASGVGIRGATLDGAMVIQLHVPVVADREEKWGPEYRPYTDRSTMLALLDTGAALTECSERFVELNGGAREFRIAGEELLRARCRWVTPEGFRDDGGLGVVELAYLGMDSLLEFAAVGWSLAPLTVYFLPRDGEEQVEEVGAAITGSGLRVRDPYR